MHINGTDDSTCKGNIDVKNRFGGIPSSSRWWSRRMCTHLLLQETKITTSCWTTTDRTLEPTKKKSVPRPETKKKPKGDGRRGTIMIKSNGNLQEIWPWSPEGFDYKTSMGWGGGGAWRQLSKKLTLGVNTFLVVQSLNPVQLVQTHGLQHHGSPLTQP